MSEGASNVILFPKNNINPSSIDSLNELREKIRQDKLEMAMEAIEEVTTELYVTLKTLGFDILKEGCEKDLVLVEEGIKSLVLKSIDIKHPMQDAAQIMIEVVP